MMNRQQFTQIAMRILRRQKGLQSPQIMHPAREWGVGLFVGILIFIVSAGWSTQMYLQYKAVSVDENRPLDNGAVVYRASLVEAALVGLRERGSVHKSLLSTVSTPVLREATLTEKPTASSTLPASENEPAASTSLDSETSTTTKQLPEEIISGES